MAKSPYASIGSRQCVVRLEQRPSTDAVDPSGAPTDGPWTTLADEEWVEKVDQRGSERFQAAQTSAAFDTAWRMGYREDMDPDVIDIAKLRRFVYQGRVHDITYGKVVGLNQELWIETLARQG